MQHLKPFSLFETHGIEWSGVNVTKAPIIGKIVTKPIETSLFNFGPAEHDVVEIVDDGNGKKIYITSEWYKSGVPQLVHETMVDKYIPAQ